MTPTTVDAPALAARIPYSERTRLVALANPSLIEAMEKAGEEYYQNEDTWQQEAVRQQRAGGMPKRDLESPYGRALREAAAAVVEKSNELLAAGGGGVNSLKPGRAYTDAPYSCTQARNSDRGSKPKMPGNLRIPRAFFYRCSAWRLKYQTKESP